MQRNEGPTAENHNFITFLYILVLASHNKSPNHIYSQRKSEYKESFGKSPPKEFHDI